MSHLIELQNLFFSKSSRESMHCHTKKEIIESYVDEFNVRFSRWTLPNFSNSQVPTLREYSVQFRSVAQSCPTLWDPTNRSMPGLPVHHHLPEFTQSRVHRVSDDIEPSHPRSSPSPPVPIPPRIKVYPMSQLFAWDGQNTGVSALESFLPKKSLGWSPSEWTGWISLQSKGPSRVFSNTTVQTHQFFGAQPSSQSNSHIRTWPQ